MTFVTMMPGAMVTFGRFMVSVTGTTVTGVTAVTGATAVTGVTAVTGMAPRRIPETAAVTVAPVLFDGVGLYHLGLGRGGGDKKDENGCNRG
jgi:hypothetical protein